MVVLVAKRRAAELPRLPARDDRLGGGINLIEPGIDGRDELRVLLGPCAFDHARMHAEEALADDAEGLITLPLLGDGAVDLGLGEDAVLNKQFADAHGEVLAEWVPSDRRMGPPLSIGQLGR